MINTERRAHSPWSTVWCLKATGLIPKARMQQLDPTGKRYMWRRTWGKSCLVRYTPRVDPNTALQQAQRQKLINGMAAWKVLSEGEQEAWEWDPKALKKRIRGRDEYISRYLLGMI